MRRKSIAELEDEDLRAQYLTLILSWTTKQQLLVGKLSVPVICLVRFIVLVKYFELVGPADTRKLPPE